MARDWMPQLVMVVMSSRFICFEILLYLQTRDGSNPFSFLFYLMKPQKKHFVFIVMQMLGHALIRCMVKYFLSNLSHWHADYYFLLGIFALSIKSYT